MRAESGGKAIHEMEDNLIESKQAKTSAHLVDLANASQFRNRKNTKDATRIAVLLTAAVALLAFLGSMIAVLLMRAPL